MRRAALCLPILTGLYRALLSIAIAFCLATTLAGCAGRPAPTQEAAAVIIYPARCARPAKPDLPKLSGLSLLESREGYARLKLRDTRLRAYLAGLEDALDCYEAQAVTTEEATDCGSSDAQLPREGGQ